MAWRTTALRRRSAAVFLLLGLAYGAATAQPFPPTRLPFYEGTSPLAIKIDPVPTEGQRDTSYDSGGLLFFQAKFGDRDAWAFLDSGAQSSLLETGLADNLSLQLFAIRGTARGLGGSQTPLRVVKDVSVLIPGQARMQFSFMRAIDRIGLGSAYGRRVQFVLGRDFLSKTAVTIDPANRVFRFAASGSSPPPAGAGVLDITPDSVIKVTINGIPLRLQIDTGLSGDLSLSPQAWRKLNLKQTGSTPVAGINGSARTSRLAQLPEMNLGSVVVRDLNVFELGGPGDGWDGQIGLGVLTRFQSTLDLGAGKLWLAPGEVNLPL